MEVRKLDIVELNSAINIINRVFEEFEYFDYDQQGKNDFYKSIQLDVLLEKLSSLKLVMLGCFVEKELLGVLGYENDRITLFYVDYNYHGKGIGKALLQYYLEAAKLDGIKQIVVNSTVFAEEIYEKYGFFKTGERISVNGMTYTPMAYNLANVALGSFVSVIVDAPLGMLHPYLPDKTYNLNVGFITDIYNVNDDFQEAYVYGVYEPIESFNGTVIGIIHYDDNDITKWIISNSIEFDKEDVLNNLKQLEYGIDFYVEWLNID